MMIYEYAPNSKKRREIITLVLCLCLSVASFALTELFHAFFSVLLQLLGIAMLFAALLVFTRCLMRRYVYHVERREDAAPDAPYDFVITEFYGSHRSVVCRIAVDEILGATRITRQTEKEFSSRRRGKRVYTYTDLLVPENGYVLEVCHEDEQFFVRILADERLLELLLSSEKQYLSGM